MNPLYPIGGTLALIVFIDKFCGEFSAFIDVIKRRVVDKFNKK